jgi:hypothetical protein
VSAGAAKEEEEEEEAEEEEEEEEREAIEGPTQGLLMPGRSCSFLGALALTCAVDLFEGGLEKAYMKEVTNREERMTAARRMKRCTRGEVGV